MHDDVLKFSAGAPFSGGLEIMHNDKTRIWYKQILMLSDLSGLPIQTVMENAEDIEAYLRCYWTGTLNGL